MSALRFAGLDGEMTGTRVALHKLFQLGIALDDGECFSSRLGWKDMPYDPEALQAIGVTLADIEDGPPAEEVDAGAAAWLASRGVEEHGLVAIGWGVTAFDIPFVITTLPRVTAYLHHHSIELNALCHSLAGSKPYLGGLPDARTWKQMARTAAEACLLLEYGQQARWHDAGYDARASMAAWRWLRAVLADPLPGKVPVRDGAATVPAEQLSVRA